MVFQFWAAISVLIAVGGAWAHLAVKFDRLLREQRRTRHAMWRFHRRLTRVESWLPKVGNKPYDSIGD